LKFLLKTAGPALQMIRMYYLFRYGRGRGNRGVAGVAGATDTVDAFNRLNHLGPYHPNNIGYIQGYLNKVPEWLYKAPNSAQEYYSQNMVSGGLYAGAYATDQVIGITGETTNVRSLDTIRENVIKGINGTGFKVYGQSQKPLLKPNIEIHEEELKAFVNINSQFFNSASTSNTQFLKTVIPSTQGIDYNQVIGSQIHVTSLEYYLYFVNSTVANATVCFRYLIVKDLQPPPQLFIITDIFSVLNALFNVFTDIFSFTNLNFRERFEILLDDFVTVNSNSPNIVKTGFLELGDIKVDFKVGSPSLIPTLNNYYCIILCDTLPIVADFTNPFIKVQTRIRYLDG